MPLLDRRRATYAYVSLLAALLACSALDTRGLRRALALEEQARRLDSDDAALEARVVRLRREVKALRGDPAALERAAREDLGWVRPGEIVYQLGEERR